MREVSQEEFFDMLRKDKRDIMPHIVGPYDRESGYHSIWKDKSGNVFGESKGKAQDNQYWLREET